MLLMILLILILKNVFITWAHKKDGSGNSYNEGVFLSTMNSNAITDTTYPYIKKRVYNITEK